ncbi:MAG: DinB family protein [Chryseolinea sp.]
MINTIKESLWTQFGGSIDMLKNAITLWPDEHWHTDKTFFYIAYHSVVFLDYYLTTPAKTFSSPLSFSITKYEDAPREAVDDVIPNKIYSKHEMLQYLEACRQKCHALINNLTEEQLSARWIEKDGNMNYSVLEILLYNMRHIQHHTGQLNMLLRQKINDAPLWVARAKDAL